MPSYYGNEKPFVYVCYTQADENVIEVLNALDENNIAYCLNDNKYDRKEAVRIDKAYGVLLFINEDFLRNMNFRKVIETAVNRNKNILCIYDKELNLDPSLTMQLSSQQALFKTKYSNNKEFIDEVLKAAIFHDMKITTGQKKNQRNRALLLVATLVMAAVLVFFVLINPYLIENRKQEQLLNQFGLNGLSDEDLEKIVSLHIVGDRIFENPEKINKVTVSTGGNGFYFYEVEEFYVGDLLEFTTSGEAHFSTIDDISILKKMPNLERLTISCENISDISPLFELKNLQTLVLDFNPITSLEGIQQCTNLQRIEIRGTEISDLSPLYKMESLQGIWAGNNKNLTSIDGFEDTEMNCLELFSSAVKEVKHLPQRDDFMLNIDDMRLSDYSFLADPLSYGGLFTGAPISAIKPYLKGKQIKRFSYNYSDLYSIRQLEGLNVTYQMELSCGRLSSLDGFGELFPEVLNLSINKCDLEDLSPLLDSNVIYLNIDQSLLPYVSEELQAKITVSVFE